MALGTIANVRALAAYPSTDEASDPEVTEALTVATQNIQVRTGVAEATWSTSPYSTFKEMAENVAEYCAASTIVLRVSNPEIVGQRSNQLRRMCDDHMKKLIDALGTVLVDNPGFMDVNASYTTYPLNPNVSAYDSTI